MARHAALNRFVGESVVDVVESCQHDLCCCFDMLVEAEAREGLERIEAQLFAAHRALNELRVEARRLVGPQPCRLLRGPCEG